MRITDFSNVVSFHYSFGTCLCRSKGNNLKLLKGDVTRYWVVGTSFVVLEWGLDALKPSLGAILLFAQITEVYNPLPDARVK